MKKFKNLSFILLIAICIIACSSNEEAVATSNLVMPESAKAPEVVAFKNALISSIKAKSILQDKSENSVEKTKIETDFFEASKTFLLASGISQDEIESKMSQNKNEIRSLAMALLAKKTAAIPNN